MFERKSLNKLSRWNHLEIGFFLSCLLACHVFYFSTFNFFAKKIHVRDIYERKILKNLSRWNHLEIGSFLTCILACQAHYFRDFQGAHRLSFWQVDTLLAGYFTMARTNSHHSHDINNVYSTPHTLASNTKQRRRSHSGSFTWALTPGARGWGFMAH